MVLPGFNTDFKYKGKVYHAQTEDNGVSNPVVVTLLYLQGAILHSKKTAYQDMLESPGFPDTLMDLMKKQHSGIMKDVLSGKFDGPAAAEPEKAPAAKAAPATLEPEPPDLAEAVAGPKSLDETIMEYLESYGSGDEARSQDNGR